MKVIMLINVEIPTIVGILTFISMINTTSQELFIFHHLSFCEQLRERSGFVVECLTRDREAAGLSLTGVSALCP